MDTPTYRGPSDLKSPVFTPRPGWGGRMRAWNRKHGFKALAILAVLAVGAAITIDQIRKDDDEPKTAKASPTPTATATPSTGVVSGTAKQHYEFRAAPGEGVTHLARYAVTNYLKDNPNTHLVPEQRIFAEDFLKDQTLADRVGSKFLEINEAIAFEITDVKAAVNAALTLSAEQIKALARYVMMVIGF